MNPAPLHNTIFISYLNEETQCKHLVSCCYTLKFKDTMTVVRSSYNIYIAEVTVALLQCSTEAYTC